MTPGPLWRALAHLQVCGAGAGSCAIGICAAGARADVGVRDVCAEDFAVWVHGGVPRSLVQTTASPSIRGPWPQRCACGFAVLGLGERRVAAGGGSLAAPLFVSRSRPGRRGSCFRAFAVRVRCLVVASFWGPFPGPEKESRSMSAN